MKKSILFLFPLILCNCMGDGTTHSQRKYLDSLKTPELTIKELAFKKELEKKGYKHVFFDTPIIGYVCSGCSSYNIQLNCPFDLTIENRDSVENANKRIAINLYSNIIEDSILSDMGTISVIFFLGNKVSKKSIYNYHYRKVYELQNDTIYLKK